MATVCASLPSTCSQVLSLSPPPCYRTPSSTPGGEDAEHITRSQPDGAFIQQSLCPALVALWQQPVFAWSSWSTARQSPWARTRRSVISDTVTSSSIRRSRSIPSPPGANPTPPLPRRRWYRSTRMGKDRSNASTGVFLVLVNTLESDYRCSSRYLRPAVDHAEAPHPSRRRSTLRDTAERLKVHLVVELVEAPSTSGYRNRGRSRPKFQELLVDP